MNDSFSKGALEKLNSDGNNKYYVYRLVDPRSFHTFYVGKGCGNRVFMHAKAAKELITKEEDADSLKLKLISEILAAGKEVICFIHRWGLSQKAAFEVEAALIDCYPGLSNIQSGHDNERGMVSVEDFEKQSNLVEYEEPEEDYIIIKTSKGAIEANGSLYEATRRSWANDINRAEKYKYVLSVINGIVKEVYEVDHWYKDGDRIAFEGKETKDAISSLKGTIIPAKYRQKGMASPFLYKNI
jgi:hypothetical protein